MASGELFGSVQMLDRDQVCALLSITPRTLSRYANRNHDPLVPAQPGTRGRLAMYEPRAVMEWSIRQEIARLQDQAGHEEPIDYTRERARLTRAQADHQELKNREARRTVARTELLSFALANLASQVAAILETLPGKIKRRVPRLSNAEVQILKREIVKCQNQCAEATIEWDQAPDMDE